MSNGNTPAFPVEVDHYQDGSIRGRQTGTYAGLEIGLTKRELFAAMAMQGLIASGYTQETFGDLQFDAVRHADALLAELSKQAE